MKQFSEGESGIGGWRASGFEVSENVVRSWLPQQPTETQPQRLTDVNRGINQLNWRIPLHGPFGSEVARVLGGGLVPGSLVLVGGDPGAGKSTLLLQIAAIIAEGHDDRSSPVVYVSGEESVEQIGNRADRMRIETEDLFLYSSTDIEDILGQVHHLSPRALVVDSIQTVYLKGVTGSAGGLLQVKECTSALLRFAKKTNIPVFLIGHVTKSGDIAGPRVLEHIVDVVLYIEGEKHSSHRLLRSVKNRFGSTDELGVFEMTQLGLQVVSNPSELFLSERNSDSERIGQWFPPGGCQMRIKFDWSVNILTVSESGLRQQIRSILGLSNIKTICGMSNFKTQEIAEMSKIFHLKLLTEKILEFLNATKVITINGQQSTLILAGLAVAVIMDGSRSFLLEIQALCLSGIIFARQVKGVPVPVRRAEMIIPVLMKQAGLKLQENGIFLNVVSGVTLAETAGDLAVAAAICSSFLEFPIPNGIAFIGEIGLGGELRTVPRIEKRVNTVAKLGYKKCVVPKAAEKSLPTLEDMNIEIVGCRNLKEVISSVFV
ncbi:unnamed protein product, partial [Vitis vinifera]|uniref:RecA family profile 1 domain-containing protein n=1 Tax=Vitis vinifera TaxID=29760 RepID=D7U088_VITVI